MSRRFLDHFRVIVQGGRGGFGNIKRKSQGGNGGDIIFRVKNNLQFKKFYDSLTSKKFTGSPGGDAGRCLIGVDAASLVVDVPAGITLETDDFKEVGSLDRHGDSLLVAEGGRGGGPANAYRAQAGERRGIHFHLKLLADVGLIGFPNAGKSSLLRALTRATPKVADYAFTTLRPQIGVIDYASELPILRHLEHDETDAIVESKKPPSHKDARKISMTDLPGLIEEAHLNRGLGFRWLKHAERTRLLVWLIDISGFQLISSKRTKQNRSRLATKRALLSDDTQSDGSHNTTPTPPQIDRVGEEEEENPFRSALQTVMLLHRELSLYDGGRLLDKPSICLINKIDLENTEEVAADLIGRLKSANDVEQTQLLYSVLPPHLRLSSSSHPLSSDWTTNNKQQQTEQEEEEGKRQFLRPLNFRYVAAISTKNGHGLEEVRQIIRQVMDDDAREQLELAQQQKSSGSSSGDAVQSVRSKLQQKFSDRHSDWV